MSIESAISPAAADEVDSFVGRLDSALGEQWTPATRKWVARAPGRLDVMGGFAEYSGSLVLSYPLARGVLVAVAPRDDQSILLCSLGHEGNGSPQQCRLPLSLFYRADGAVADPDTVAAAVHREGCDSARDVAAALYAMLKRRTVEHFGGGATIGVRSGLSGTVGLGAAAAVSVASVSALARALDVQLTPMACAELATHGQNLLCNRAQGIAEAAGIVLGRPGEILQLHCRTREILGGLPLPAGVTLAGIDCGARSPLAGEKYMDARAAAFMGRKIIARIMASATGGSLNWSGHLSQVSVADYVERLRDRLPTKIKGAAFIERFGESDDPLSSIDPAKLYKVRSRAEHHIYENARAQQFVERTARAVRTGDRQAVIEAGELMYASHWSYGQRCGLGSIETDRLVNLLRKMGPSGGVYGAKISGRGAGGTVVVMHADSDQARDAVRRVVEEYARHTDCGPDTLTGTGPGAAAWGVHEIS